MKWDRLFRQRPNSTCEKRIDIACRRPGRSPSSSCSRFVDRDRRRALETSGTFVGQLWLRSSRCPAREICPIKASPPVTRSPTAATSGTVTAYHFRPSCSSSTSDLDFYCSFHHHSLCLATHSTPDEADATAAARWCLSIWFGPVAPAACTSCDLCRRFLNML